MQNCKQLLHIDFLKAVKHQNAKVGPPLTVSQLMVCLRCFRFQNPSIKTSWFLHHKSWFLHHKNCECATAGLPVPGLWSVAGWRDQQQLGNVGSEVSRSPRQPDATHIWAADLADGCPGTLFWDRTSPVTLFCDEGCVNLLIFCHLSGIVGRWMTF